MKTLGLTLLLICSILDSSYAVHCPGSRNSDICDKFEDTRYCWVPFIDDSGRTTIRYFPPESSVIVIRDFDFKRFWMGYVDEDGCVLVQDGDSYMTDPDLNGYDWMIIDIKGVDLCYYN